MSSSLSSSSSSTTSIPSQNPDPLYPQVILSNPDPLYPQVILSNPESDIPSSSSVYPSLDTKDLPENLFPEKASSEEVLVKLPGAIVHLIEKEHSVELACGELSIVALRQYGDIAAVLARVNDDIQWPLAKDEPAVKLDDSHYFFSLRVPTDGDNFEVLNYGLTIAAKGQKGLLKELDKLLERYSCFSVQKVKEMGSWEIVAKETTPCELHDDETRELLKRNAGVYWTTLAPNVEDYSGSVAKLIAAGSGQLIRGILWCGDMTVDGLNWGHEFLKKRTGPPSNSDVSPETLERIRRVKKLTKMSEKVAVVILSGVVKVSEFFTSAIVNSKMGKKFFGLLPGEIVLASLDGFNKVCDAAEVAGKNVMSSTSVATTGLVSQRYGEEVGKATNEGLDAAGHAIGTAWSVFKIRKALNPKGVLKPTTLAKAAAADFRAKTTN